MAINGEFPKNCSVCIRAKKTRIQNHKIVPQASKPLHQIYMDFWGPYRHGSIDGSQYILTLIDNHMRNIWIFIIKIHNFEELIKVLKP